MNKEDVIKLQQFVNSLSEEQANMLKDIVNEHLKNKRENNNASNGGE